MKNKYDYTKKYGDNHKEEISETSIEETFADKESTVDETGTGFVNVSLLNVRSEPDIFSEQLTQVIENDELLIESGLNDDSDWYKICTAKGIEGYVLKEYVKID